MTARQERKARKQRQRSGQDTYIHNKPIEGTRPYASRAQTRQERLSIQQAERAAMLALGVAPLIRSVLLNGGSRFGDKS